MTDFTREIAVASAAIGVDAQLVTALIQVESSGNPFAWNPEPRYRYLWNVRDWKPFRTLTATENASGIPPADFPTLAGDRDQEWWGQRASWGLCQIMGAVARERGFRGPYLPQLCDPAINLAFGCLHLKRLLEWADGNELKALGAYNAGGGYAGPVGQAYAQKVLRTMEQNR